MQSDPSGIGNDRAAVERIDAGEAVLQVGPGRTPVHVPVSDLPEGVRVGDWVVLDLQLQPPLVLRIDDELTRARRDDD